MQGLKPTKRDSYGRLILGDIITSVNGKKVSNGSDLYRILDQCEVGEKVPTSIFPCSPHPFSFGLTAKHVYVSFSTIRI